MTFLRERPTTAPTSKVPEDILTEELSPARLPLVESISETFDKLPPINLFRAAANARTLYPVFIQYMYPARAAPRSAKRFAVHTAHDCLRATEHR